MRFGVPCLAGFALFGVLSLTDFVQTYALIGSGNGRVVEGNPFAAAWLDRYGWGGLAVFKVGAVAVFVGAAVLISRRSTRATSGVLTAACAVLLSVTLYSGRLLADERLARAEEPAAEVGDGELNPLPRAAARAPGRRLPPPPELDTHGGPAARDGY